MKKTHLLFDFKHKSGGQGKPEDPRKDIHGRKKVHPQPTKNIPVPNVHNPVPSTSRDARIILDPLQVPTYHIPPLEAAETSRPQPHDDEGTSRDSSVSQSTSNSSVGDIENAVKVVRKKVKNRRMGKRRLVKVVDDACLKLKNAGQKDSVDELKRMEGESFMSFHCRIFHLRFEITREKLRSSWKSLKEKKEKWDKWNPDKSHPLVKCINESKMSGLKETIRHDRGIFWRLNWFLAWTMAISSGVTFFVSAYYFHHHFPILFGFKTKQAPINQVPFVTVTVCPSHSFKPEGIENIKKLLANLDQTSEDKGEWSEKNVLDLMAFVDHICLSKSTFRSVFGVNEEIFQEALYLIKKENKKLLSQLDVNLITKIQKILLKISTPQKEFLEMCVWNTETDKDCTNFFRPKLTSNGMCYTFNAIPPEDLYTKTNEETRKLEVDPERSSWNWGNWNLDEHKFDDENRGNVVGRRDGPRIQPSGGNRWGLKFKVRTEEYLSSNCNQFDGLGPRVFVSVPGLDLDESKLATSIPPNSDVTIKLYPDLTLSDPETADIEPERRGCLFQREKKLHYYKKYTQENCQRECVAINAAAECGCTLLSFPNFPGKPLCLTQEELICLKIVEEELLTNKGCNECLPSCSQMTIRDEVVSTPLSEDSRRVYSGHKNESFSFVSMFYAVDNIVPKERQRRFSKYELISVFGSIFETTNDLSLLGFARTSVGLSELKPTIATHMKVLFKTFTANLMRVFDIIKRLLGLTGQSNAVLPFLNRSA